MSSDRFRIELDTNPKRARQPVAASENHSVRIVILGDFQGLGGNAAEGGAGGELGPLLTVDAETLDRIIARLAPHLDLRFGHDVGFEVTIGELEDFHPDRLITGLKPLESLLSVRERAERSRESSDALRKAASLPPREAAPSPDKPKVARRPPPAGSVLDWIVEGDKPAAPTVPSDLDQFLEEVVTPHLAVEPDADRAALLADLDTAISANLRQVLHHPHFQALEALWRGTALLVHRLETGPSLRVYLLQATRGALLADARSAADPNRSELGRALRALPPDGGPTLLVADLLLDAREEDLEILKALGSAALALGGIVIGGAAPGLIGGGESSQPEGPWDVQPWSHADWIAFRRTPEAESVALALPRILLRAPYGRTGEAIQSFDFEEMSVPPHASQFMWANPAFVSALILGGTLASGSAPSPGDRLEADGLAVHSWRGPDGSVLVPCTEWTMRMDVVAALMKAGLMVLVPGGNGDSARLLRFQTLESNA